MNVSVEFTVFAVFIGPLSLSVLNFRLFVVWDKPKIVGKVYSSSKRPINSINNFIVFSVQLIFGIALKCMRGLSR